jgi:hypothetical protein
MKQAFRRILIVVVGAVAAVFVVSGGFWIGYGGDWPDYLKLGFVPFVILVPSRIWHYSESLAFTIALLYWFVLLAIIYTVSALVSWSRLRHKNLVYIGLTTSALAVYSGCYWLTVLAFRAITCFYLPPFRYF